MSKNSLMSFGLLIKYNFTKLVVFTVVLLLTNSLLLAANIQNKTQFSIISCSSKNFSVSINNFVPTSKADTYKAQLWVYANSDEYYSQAVVRNIYIRITDTRFSLYQLADRRNPDTEVIYHSTNEIGSKIYKVEKQTNLLKVNFYANEISDLLICELI